MANSIWLDRRARHAVKLATEETRSSGAVGASTVADFSLDGCCFIGHFQDWRERGSRGQANRRCAGASQMAHDGKNGYALPSRLIIVRVVDASSPGSKVEFVDRPQIADHVWVKFVGFESQEARVCWIDDFSAGPNFSRPIPPAVFDLPLRRLI